ncbi:MAG: hypothetical protein P8I93_06555 [Crocinitomicaceae bacterium]|nr:hypothetical protein [Crocinitomicaceae bacterium]
MNNRAFILFTLILISLIAFSCEGNGEVKKELKSKKTSKIDQSLNEDYYQFSKLYLLKSEIQGTIMLPNETSRLGTSEKPKVQHEHGGFKWEISVGPSFSLYLEDYGKQTNLIKNHKIKLKTNNVYKIEFLKELPNLLIYKKTLKETNNHTSYFIYAQKKINNITYEIKNKPQGNRKDIVDVMEKSILSFNSSI